MESSRGYKRPRVLSFKTVVKIALKSFSEGLPKLSFRCVLQTVVSHSASKIYIFEINSMTPHPSRLFKLLIDHRDNK